MKRNILIGLLALTLVLAAGCMNTEPTPTPTPMVTNPPTTAPTTQPTSPVVESPLPSASLTPDATAGGSVIEGFVEGETVKESDLPEKVAQAIRDAYEQVKIKTITFATYMNDQVYHVILSEPAGEDKVEQFYIKADGTIVPYTAEGTASPAA